MSLHLLEVDRPDTRQHIAKALPEPAREALKQLIAGRAEDDCVALSQVATLMRAFDTATAVFGNWLTYVTADIPVRDGYSSWECSLYPFPVVLVQQVIDAAPDLADEQVARLAKLVGLESVQAGAGRKSASAAAAPKTRLEQAQEQLAEFTRPLQLRYRVLQAVRERWLLRAAAGARASPAAGAVPSEPSKAPVLVSEAVQAERERCIRLCEEAAALYPESVWPDAGAGDDAKGPVLARNLARRIARDISAGG